MSVHVLSLVYSRRLGGALIKAVALKLADHANDDGGSVYPSIARVAAECEVSRSTTKRSIKMLIDIGVLKVVTGGGAGAGDTTEYRFLLDALSGLPFARKQSTQNPLTHRERGSPKTNKGSTRRKKGVQAKNHEPSLNHHQTKTREREEKISVLKSEVKAVERPPALPARVSRRADFSCRPASVEWDKWMAWFDANDRDDIAGEAREAGVLHTKSKFPPQALA